MWRTHFACRVETPLDTSAGLNAPPPPGVAKSVWDGPNRPTDSDENGTEWWRAKAESTLEQVSL